MNSAEQQIIDRIAALRGHAAHMRDKTADTRTLAERYADEAITCDQTADEYDAILANDGALTPTP